MSLMEIMRNRRSVRNYTGEQIPEEKLEAILQAGLLYFSGKGIYPCEMVLVKDPEMLSKMADCKSGSGKLLRDAYAAVAVLGDGDKSDTIIEDSSIMMTQMLLMADSLGVGGVWLQYRLRKSVDGRDADEALREVLGYPENVHIEAVLCMGMPESHADAHDLPDVKKSTIIHYEKY